jgi:hypothetical protein
MQNTIDEQMIVKARESLARRLNFDDFLAKLSPKDRASAERRISVLEGEPDQNRARLWRRLACTLMTLAPHAAKLVGRQTLQLYVADGKYRMQVFALEDLQDGNFTIYCPDVLGEVVKAGLVSRSTHDEAHAYVVESSDEPLRIEPLDASSRNSADHYKDMTGWNRKALRITLPPSASVAQIETAELICAIAAQHFVRVAPLVAAAPPKS